MKLGTYESDNKTSTTDKIEWKVLAVEKDRVLLISKYVLDAKSFSGQGGDTYWELSSVRTWLNGDFYKNAFSDTEKEKILSTVIRDGLTKDTDSVKDKVFLLSAEEANKYFKDNAARMSAPTKYATARDTWSRNGYAEWWLRTAAKDSASAMTVKDTGSVNESGRNNEITWCGIRPAIWIKK